MINYNVPYVRGRIFTKIKKPLLPCLCSRDDLYRGSTLIARAHGLDLSFQTVTESPGRIGAARRWSSDDSAAGTSQLPSPLFPVFSPYSSRHRFGLFSLPGWFSLPRICSRIIAPNKCAVKPQITRLSPQTRTRQASSTVPLPSLWIRRGTS